MKTANRSIIGVTLVTLLSFIVATPADADHSRVDQAALVSANSGFAFDLYQHLCKTEGNLFFSPYSVSTALAMTYAGARAETAAQMADVMHFEFEPARLHAAFGELIESSRSSPTDSACRLDVANALWGQQNIDFLEDFINLTGRHYGAGLREVDFANDPQSARKIINEWIARETEQMIPELLRAGDINRLTELVLTNAIYFKGDWATRFDEEATGDGTFVAAENTPLTVPMMHGTGAFRVTSTDTLDVLELPYASDRLAMMIILPKAVDGLADAETLLTRTNLDQWTAQLSEQTLQVSIPRFRLGWRQDLGPTLVQMGMADAFDETKADFSGMTGRRALEGRGRLYIAAVIHQAEIAVDEQGAEASAATAVVMKKRSAPARFVADHPFAFLIRDRQTGSILFLGRVVDPR